MFRNEILIAIDKLFRIMIPISIHQRKIKIYPTNLSNKFGRKPQRGQAAWNRPQSNNSQSFGSIRRTRAFKAAKDKLTVGRRCRSTKLPGWKTWPGSTHDLRILCAQYSSKTEHARARDGGQQLSRSDLQRIFYDYGRRVACKPSNNPDPPLIYNPLSLFRSFFLAETKHTLPPFVFPYTLSTRFAYRLCARSSHYIDSSRFLLASRKSEVSLVARSRNGFAWARFG